MKSRWLYLVLAFLIPLTLAGVRFYQVRGCDGGAANGTAVWVPHLNMCAATVNDGGDAYVLDVDTVCGTEEGDCRYIYRSPVTGVPLVLPDSVGENLTPNSYPASFSPELKNLIYVDRTEEGSEVHVYDLVNGMDSTPATFGLETTGLFDFEWLGGDQFSFVALNYDAADAKNFTATRYLYEWHDEMWNLVLMEAVEGGTVECNPIYCELK